jgi:hypothetical protein
MMTISEEHDMLPQPALSRRTAAFVLRPHGKSALSRPLPSASTGDSPFLHDDTLVSRSMCDEKAQVCSLLQASQTHAQEHDS